MRRSDVNPISVVVIAKAWEERRKQPPCIFGVLKSVLVIFFKYTTGKMMVIQAVTEPPAIFYMCWLKIENWIIGNCKRIEWKPTIDTSLTNCN